MSRRGRRVPAIVVIAALSATACGPIDVPAGNLGDEASGPRVRLTATQPRAAFRFSFTINDSAAASALDAGFMIDAGDHVGLGDRAGPLVPLRVTLWRTDDRGRERVELRRAWCRGMSRCVGDFEVVFVRLPTAQVPLTFDWRVGGSVNFTSASVPDGAHVDVTLPVPV